MDQIERILNLIKDDDLERLGKLNEVEKCNTWWARLYLKI